MKPFRKLFCMLAVSLVLAALCPAQTGPYLYMMSLLCWDNYPCVAKMDIPTGNIVTWYTGLSQGGENGRGVAVVGNLMYWTTAQSGNVNVYDLNARKWLFGFNVTGSGTYLSSLATDGTTLWAQEYTTTGNSVYAFDITNPFAPKYLNTIKLPLCTGYCDGLEVITFFDGQKDLLANRGDHVDPYDEYDSAGAIAQPAYIAPPTGDAGIAWEGTCAVLCGAEYFYTSDLLGHNIHVFNGSGTLIRTIPIQGLLYPSQEFEDLSLEVQPPPPPPATPCHEAASPSLAVNIGGYYGNVVAFVPLANWAAGLTRLEGAALRSST